MVFVLGLTAVATYASAQSPVATPAPAAANGGPTLEVATIKPSSPEDHGPSSAIAARRFSFTRASIYDLFDFAYGMQQRQIFGAPDWVDSTRYNIEVVAAGDSSPDWKQWQAIYKKLMAERFHLTFHYEKREMSVYLLTLARKNPPLKRNDSDKPGALRGGHGNVRVVNQTIADLALFLGHGFMDRPVVDQTGLIGKFDLTLSWTPEDDQPGALTAASQPGFFTAIQEQAGLKLIPAKATVDVVVIDHVEGPSEN